MQPSITPNVTNFEELQLNIYDSKFSYYGGSQYWFPKKFNMLSGCGPVAAANITVYLSQAFPDKYNTLYPHTGIVSKVNFTEHMVEIRKFVKPGLFGLTSVHKFSDNILAFASERGVSLIPHILDDKAVSLQEAINFISISLSQSLPIAILVLKHPLVEFKEYTWHWMTITNLKHNFIDNIYYLSVSTYGERREINLNLLWNHRCSKDIISLAYFT